jgi:hypothetical protein
MKYFKEVFRRGSHKNFYFSLIKKVFRSKLTRRNKELRTTKIKCNIMLSETSLIQQDISWGVSINVHDQIISQIKALIDQFVGCVCVCVPHAFLLICNYLWSSLKCFGSFKEIMRWKRLKSHVHPGFCYTQKWIMGEQIPAISISGAWCSVPEEPRSAAFRCHHLH